MTMRSPHLTALGVLAAIALVPACGGDDNAKTARTATTRTTPAATATIPAPTSTTTTSTNAKNDPSAGRVVRSFYNAMSRRNGDAACRYLNEAMKQSAIQFIRRLPGNTSIRTCGAAMTESVRRNTATQLRPLHNVAIVSSTADGALATVKVKRAAKDVLLTRQGGRWVIASGVFNAR